MFKRIIVGLFSKKPLQFPPWIKSIEERNTLRILRLRGGLNINTIQKHIQFITELRKQKGFEFKDMLLDLADVNYIDSATIAALVEALHDYKKAHHRMGIVNLHGEPLSMLQITKIDKLISLYETEAQAIQDLETK